MSRTTDFQSPWRFWHGAGVLAAAMTLYTGLSWGHMELVRQTVGMEAYLGNGPRLPVHVLLAGQWIKAVALIGVLVLLALWPKRLGWAAVGLRPVAGIWIALAICVALVLFLFRLGLARMIRWSLPGWADFMPDPFIFGAGQTVWMAGLYLVTTLVVTPVVEEVFFRGFLFKWMSGHRPVWLAAGLSSVMFGVMHILPPQAISAALMALVLCWLYWRTGSIWPAIAAHMTNNALGVVIGALGVSGLSPGS
ncbi:type II CAAX endopeptidase family protein [Maricaulis alexandrii]|uniref:type II CAAX endopeptidase family protein n=1 Tax=Maricaulis alexandrii TaxID=2570354 RepID=UPI001109C631|nr:type II CAAX endopeptidase family protein [Maricaulis alexandrii]